MQNWEDEFRAVLTEHFSRLKEQDPKFSLRALAKRARISPSAMSQLLRKKHGWQLSVERAIEILSSLGVEERTRYRLTALMGRPLPVLRATLKTADCENLKDWTYLPILHSFDLTPTPSLKEIAQKLGVEPEKVESVVNDLLNRGYLKKLDSDLFKRDESHKENIECSWQKMSSELQKSELEIASKALSASQNGNRVFGTVTFAGNKAQVAFLKKEIEKLFNYAAAVVENTEPRDELFKLSVQFYPLDFRKEEE